jgi:hypothetical protein
MKHKSLFKVGKDTYRNDVAEVLRTSSRVHFICAILFETDLANQTLCSLS